MPAAADGARRPEHSANDLNDKEARGKVPTDATHANGAIITKCQLPHGAIIEIKMLKKTCDDVLRLRHVNLKGRGLRYQVVLRMTSHDQSSAATLRNQPTFAGFAKA